MRRTWPRNRAGWGWDAFVNEWLIWQLADATFPAGGFAHSAGLEAARHWGELRGPDRLVEFLEASLAQAGHSLVPFAAAAHEDPATLAEADWRCHVFLSNHVANRASRLQGKAWLVAAEAAFGLKSLGQRRAEIRDHRLHGHFAPLFGAVTAALGIDLETATRLLLYMVLRGLIASAIRLNVVGPLEGQAIQFRLGPLAEQWARRSAAFRLDDAAQTAPGLEIFQATQDRLYSRLFQS